MHIDLSDRRVRLLALLGLVAFGLAAGLELAARLRGGAAPLAPGSERARRPAFPSRAQSGPEAIGMDEVLGLLARYRDEPSAKELAEAFMTEPDLSGAWKKVQEDGDMEAFSASVRASPATGKLKASRAFEKLAPLLASDRSASALGLAFGADLGRPREPAVLAASGPVERPRALSSGGPILPGAARPAQTGAPAGATPAVAAGANPGQAVGSPSATPAPKIPTFGQAANASKAEASGAAGEPRSGDSGARGGGGQGGCPMSPVCREESRYACESERTPASFADVRRQGCGCAIHDMNELLRLPANGALLAALGGEGGFSAILASTDGAMRQNAQVVGRCAGFERLGEGARRQSGRREGELWQAELRKQLRRYAERRGLPFDDKAR